MKYSWPIIETGWSGYKGCYIRYNNRFFKFFWKPYSDGYYDSDDTWHKSKKFQFLTFTLGSSYPRKGKNMNVNNNTSVANADMAAAVAVNPKLTDEQLAALLATKPDGEMLDYANGGVIAYTTDAPETDDEPTIH